MKQSNTTISGLDIQSEYLTVAQYNADEHAVMLVAIQPLDGAAGGITSGSVSAELGTLKSKFKFGAAPINCSLAGEYAVIKKVPVEYQEKDIESALQWELGQHIIGSVEEYAFDYQHCGTGSGGLEEYLVVAYRKDKVEAFAAELKRHKLICGVVDLDLFALINVFEANYPEAAPRPAVLLHAESTRAKLVVTGGGSYIDHEIFSYDDSPDPHTMAGRITEETQRLCTVAGLQESGAGLPLYATGSLFAQAGYIETVQSITGTIAPLNPFRKVGCRVGVDNEQLNMYIPQLAVAVGCALQGADEV